MRVYLLILVAFFSVAANGAVEFPGPEPGKASSRIIKSSAEYILSNNVIAVSWKLRNGTLILHAIENKLSGKSYIQDSAPIFELQTPESREAITDWEICGGPKLVKLKAESTSPSTGKHFRGKAIIATLKSRGAKITVKWMAELRDNAGYVRTTIELVGIDDSAKIVNRVQLLSNIKVDNAVQAGYQKGSPVQSDQVFFGIEVPFFQNQLDSKRINSGFDCKLKLSKDISHTFSSVIGVFPKEQFRRAFLHYIERERVCSYRQFLHYNCWFDLQKRVSERGMLDRINSIHKELGEKRGVQVVSFVIDDGYDDYHKGFWVFNTNKFPNGFTPIEKRLTEINSNLGVWLSPAGGYVGRGHRLQQAKKIGIESFDLSNPVYYKWFLDRHTRFIKEDKVNYFKWDRLGKGGSNHFMSLMRIAHKLREINPELFLNTTCGSWQSPFWLNHIDCTWRGGGDMGYAGKGCEREKWITYRDGASYNAIKKSDFIYPLNALMNHGIVYAKGNRFAARALRGSKDLRNEVRSYFGGGYALQELYINPHIMTEEHWDSIAESALWAKKQASVLVDSHFIGGDPNELQVYGFAAWQNNQGVITLRNPSDTPQVYGLDVQSAFELPENSSKNYVLETPYKKDQRIAQLTATAAVPVSIELKPFEVLVFDAYPNNKIESGSRGL